MRPKKLIMEAFGPYAKKQEIDFTKLKDENIFLITGNTGAGKTTIFDAISFALYGKTGSGRDGENLKSQYAGDDVLCKVEYSFVLRGIDYNVSRTPAQKTLKRGKISEKKPEAFLVIVQKGKDDVIYSGYSTVTKKLEEILGLDYNQFSKIMMLPQGEFRKLLVSEKKEREELLQKIFGTYLYKKLEIILKELEKQKREEIEKINTRIDENLRRVEDLEEAISEDEIIKSLKSMINDYEKEIDNLNKNINKLSGDILLQNKELLKGEEINEKFLSLNKLEVSYKKIMEDEAFIKLKKDKVTLGKKAETVKPYEEIYKTRKLELQKREKDLSLKEDEVNHLVTAKDKALNELNIAKEKAKNIEKLQYEINYLTSLKEKIENLEAYKNENVKLSKELNLQKDRLLKSAASLLKEETRLKEIYKEKESLIDLPKLLAEKENSIFLFKGIKDKLPELLEHYSNIKELRKTYVTIKDKLINKEKQYVNQKEKVENLEKEFSEGQRALLAKSLVEGEPCPVCGSTVHPNICCLSSTIPEEAYIKSEKEKLVFLEEEKSNLKINLSKSENDGQSEKKLIDILAKDISLNLNSCKIDESYKNLIKLREPNSDNLGILKDSLKELNALLNLENENMAVLKNNNLRLKALKEEEQTLMKKIEELKILKEKQQENSEDIVKKYARSEENLKNILNDIPQNLQDINAYKAHLNNLLNEYKLLDGRVKNADEALKKALSSECSAKEALSQIKKYKDECSESLENSYTRLNDEIKKCGFESINIYMEAKLSEDMILNLEEEIKLYEEKKKSLEDEIIKAKEDLKDKSPMNLQAIKDKINSYEALKAKISEDLKLTFSKLQTKKEVYINLKALYDSRKKKNEEYGVIGNLSKTASGMNMKNLNFERYVLSAFFEDIIVAANLRFKKMTSGRYYMLSSSEVSDRRSMAGLELMVFDNYTGKERSVKTLSGGEGFKASLCLALGLADVVSQYSGGVSLDTIFIDEGFGTLDQESLDNAIECLIDLQKGGRLVGIISHVPELKERINCKLIVQDSLQGSEAFFCY